MVSQLLSRLFAAASSSQKRQACRQTQSALIAAVKQWSLVYLSNYISRISAAVMHSCSFVLYLQHWVVLNASPDNPERERASELLDTFFVAFQLKRRFCSPVAPHQANIDKTPVGGIFKASMRREHLCIKMILQAFEGALLCGGCHAHEVKPYFVKQLHWRYSHEVLSSLCLVTVQS